MVYMILLTKREHFGKNAMFFITKHLKNNSCNMFTNSSAFMHDISRLQLSKCTDKNK